MKESLCIACVCLGRGMCREKESGPSTLKHICLFHWAQCTNNLVCRLNAMALILYAPSVTAMIWQAMSSSIVEKSEFWPRRGWSPIKTASLR